MATYRYWQHFLALESDFAATARYVEFAEANFKTYSTEYVKLLLAVGSEIDVLCKIVCERVNPGATRGNMDQYRSCITAHTELPTEEVLVRRYSLSFKPWENWVMGKNPAWWRSYNNVKHERDRYFHEANLENCINAIGALFVLVIYCHEAEKSADALEPMPLLIGREKEPGNILVEQGYDIPAFR